MNESSALAEQSVGVGSATTITAPIAKPRICSECEEAIPPARLKAMPSARLCVPCQEKLGDVPVIRRYDDTGLDGEVAQTYYTANKDFERERVRRNNAAIKFSDIEQEPSARVAPDPESRSVGAQNLGSAATEREADLHREASKKYKETWALKMSA